MGDHQNQSSENWPDKELLEKALRKWMGKSEIKIAGFTSQVATNKGDNYFSDMFRVTITFEHKKDSLTIVIKRLISMGSSADFLTNSSAFRREEQMLAEVMPEMHGALKKVIPDVEHFGASFVFASPGVLMMEDLQQGGFRMAQRRLGLDLQHCSLVLRTLARYHAASVFIMERKSIDLSVFQKSMFGTSHIKEQLENFYTGMVRSLAEELENCDVLSKYSPKLYAFADRNFLTLLIQVMENHEDDDFLVISHGDLWVNNIMFRYSPSGEPDGIRFVDLQFASITSPCIDIQYFLTASSNESVRTTCTDQLLEEYHETLCKTMAALECSTRPPTIEQLRKDYDKRTHYGMLAALSVMPIVLAEPGQFDFSTAMEGGKPQNDLFRNKSYRKALEWFLPLYESKGFL